MLFEIHVVYELTVGEIVDKCTVKIGCKSKMLTVLTFYELITKLIKVFLKNALILIFIFKVFFYEG